MTEKSITLSGAAVSFVSKPEVHTYFILNERTGDIKIGIARDIFKRLKTLQTGSCDRLVLLHSMTGNSERELHAKFAKDRIPGGEWFHQTIELMNKIKELKQPWDSKPDLIVRTHDFDGLKVLHTTMSVSLFELACTAAKAKNTSVNDMISVALRSYLRKPRSPKI